MGDCRNSYQSEYSGLAVLKRRVKNFADNNLSGHINFHGVVRDYMYVP